MCKFEQVSESDSVGQWGRELDKLLALKVKSVGVEHAQFGWAGEGEGGLVGPDETTVERQTTMARTDLTKDSGTWVQGDSGTVGLKDRRSK